MSSNLRASLSLISSFLCLLLYLPAFVSPLRAQELTKMQQWHLLDEDADSMPGISAVRVHAEIGKTFRPLEVVVAVIDGGIDTDHKDLIPVLWKNRKEDPQNGLDDDGNGYIDDLRGWSFISGPGGEVNQDTYEVTREWLRLEKLKKAGVRGKNDTANSTYAKMVRFHYQTRRKEARANFKNGNKLRKGNLSVYVKIQRLGGDSADVAAVRAGGRLEKRVLSIYSMSKVMGNRPSETYAELNSLSQRLCNMYQYNFNPDFNPRGMVGDKYEDGADRIYGDKRVTGPDAGHGTHVAGIIAGAHGNQLGMNGVAPNARIMCLRAVPNGDERDKDVANAIRYAADMGAKVINMSFGKPFSPGESLVQEAIRYAASRDVLMVHAAGNDALFVPDLPTFPRAPQIDDARFSYWIEVGAVDFAKDPADRIASFSNYGSPVVDVFAPGHEIYSTMPDNEYEALSGTSMAAPVVAGMAALLRGLYPKLSAPEIRDIIVSSVKPLPDNLVVPEPNGAVEKIAESQKSSMEDRETASAREVCVSGGVVNLERALKYAKERFPGQMVSGK